MIRKDYILRLLADMAKFIAQLLKMYTEKDAQKGYHEAVKKIEELFGLDFSSFLEQPTDRLLEHEAISNSSWVDLTGELLQITGNFAGDLNLTSEKTILLRKALFLLEYNEQNSKSFSFQRLTLINQVKDQLGIH